MDFKETPVGIGNHTFDKKYHNMNSQQRPGAHLGNHHSFNQKFTRMKKLIMILVAVPWLFGNCEEAPYGQSHEAGISAPHSKKYPADVAVEWINLQQTLIKTTPGFDPLVASRSFSFSGLALYESIVKGMPGYQSVVSSQIGIDINALPKKQLIHWPASANAAMALMLRNLFANTSAANMDKIDSLEAAFNAKFQNQATPEVLGQSASYGRIIAYQIFEWSKTDGGHEAYLAATSANYVPPAGPGKWIPTPPAFSKPIRPYWGDNRSFVPNSASITMPPPPSYSENVESEFYQAAHEVYDTSLSLTAEDSAIVKTWGDLPGNYGTPAHYTNIATQLILENRFSLDKAALTYAKHGIALYEATICVFKAKYTYNLIRPVSYIRNILGHEAWGSVIGTPPHPEYPSAHAVIGGASYIVLESIIGKNYSFVDRTHENLFGARAYDNLKAYAVEAAWSRVLGGIHFNSSANIGLTQGEHVGNLINKVAFKEIVNDSQ